MIKVAPAERLRQRIQAGQEALQAGRPADAVVEWSAALRSAGRLPVVEAVRTTLRNNLAGLYHSLGKVSQARRLYRDALRAAEQQQGAQSVAAATILNNLAELERGTGQPGKAEPLFRRALSILESQKDVQVANLAGLMANQAECLRQSGRTDEAAVLNSRALEILERSGAAPGQIGILLNNMASLEEQRGDFVAAEALFARALPLLEQAGAALAKQRLQLLANYALVLRKHAASLEGRGTGFRSHK